MFDHPAVEFSCRHCGENAGYDPEICFYCGPICGKCFGAEPDQNCPKHTPAAQQRNAGDGASTVPNSDTQARA